MNGDDDDNDSVELSNISSDDKSLRKFLRCCVKSVLVHVYYFAVAHVPSRKNVTELEGRKHIPAFHSSSPSAWVGIIIGTSFGTKVRAGASCGAEDMSGFAQWQRQRRSRLVPVHVPAGRQLKCFNCSTLLKQDAVSFVKFGARMALPLLWLASHSRDQQSYTI